MKKDIIGENEPFLSSPEPMDYYNDEESQSPDWRGRRMDEMIDGEPESNYFIPNGGLSIKKRNSNQFEALLKNMKNNGKDEFSVIEMDISETKSAVKMKFDPSSYTAMYNPVTNMIVWSNGNKWVRKDFAPFRGHWRDAQAHLIVIEDNGTVTYIEPKELGSYSAIICGFFKIGICFGNYIYTAKLIGQNILKWDNGMQWTKVKMDIA